MENLASPSSYKRISVKVSDSQLLDEARFRAYTGIDPRVSVPKQARLRSIYLEYDASNLYGAVVRNWEFCSFTITQQQHVDAGSIPMERSLGKPVPDLQDPQGSVPLPADDRCCLDDALSLQANAVE